jgi:hypothetical protein
MYIYSKDLQLDAYDMYFNDIHEVILKDIDELNQCNTLYDEFKEKRQLMFNNLIKTPNILQLSHLAQSEPHSHSQSQSQSQSNSQVKLKFNDLKDISCAICFESIDDAVQDIDVDILDCGHCYHSNCIINITKCPLCRETFKVVLSNYRDTFTSLNDIYKFLIYQTSDEYIEGDINIDNYFNLMINNVVKIMNKLKLHENVVSSVKIARQKRNRTIDNNNEIDSRDPSNMSNEISNMSNEISNMSNEISNILLPHTTSPLELDSQISINSNSYDETTALLREKEDCYMLKRAEYEKRNIELILKIVYILSNKNVNFEYLYTIIQKLLGVFFINIKNICDNIVADFINNGIDGLSHVSTFNVGLDTSSYQINYKFIYSIFNNILTTNDTLLTTVVEDKTLLTSILNNLYIPPLNIVKLFIDKGKKVLNIVDTRGNTPIHLFLSLLNNAYVTNQNIKNLVKLLVGNKNNQCLLTVNKHDKHIPLHLAIFLKQTVNINILKLLIDKNQNALLAQDWNNDTPLHCLFIENNFKPLLIKCLIDNKQKCLTLKNEAGNTPVHILLMKNKMQLDLVELCIDEKNKCLEIRNECNLYPIDIFRFYGISNDVLEERLMNNKAVKTKLNVNSKFIRTFTENLSGHKQYLDFFNRLFTSDIVHINKNKKMIKEYLFICLHKNVYNKDILKNIIGLNPSILTSNLEYNNTFLHFVIFNNNYMLPKLHSVIDIFIDLKKKVLMRKNSEGYYPIHLFLKHVWTFTPISIAIIKKLVNYNNPIDNNKILTNSANGFYPIHIFLTYNKWNKYANIELLYDILSLLIDDKKKVIDKSIFGNTINSETSLNNDDNMEGITPLILLLMKHITSIKCLKLLITEKNLLTKDKDGDSPIAQALFNKYRDINILRLLIDKHELCLTIPNKNNHIPLTYALVNLGITNLEVLDTLIDNKKTVLHRKFGVDNKTPFELAIDLDIKQRKVLRLLKGNTSSTHMKFICKDCHKPDNI